MSIRNAIEILEAKRLAFAAETAAAQALLELELSQAIAALPISLQNESDQALANAYHAIIRYFKGSIPPEVIEDKDTFDESIEEV